MKTLAGNRSGQLSPSSPPLPSQSRLSRRPSHQLSEYGQSAFINNLLRVDKSGFQQIF